jgi:hypothetical protein
VTKNCTNSDTGLHAFAVEFGTPFGLHMLWHAGAEGSLSNQNGGGVMWDFTEPTIRQDDQIVEGILSEVPEPSTLVFGLGLLAIGARKFSGSSPPRPRA